MLAKLGLPVPVSASDFWISRKLMGAFLASQLMVTHTPKALMECPVQPGHDTEEHLWNRAVCDSRIHCPLEDLFDVPGLECLKGAFQTAGHRYVTVTHWWRCNSLKHWLAEITDPRVAVACFEALGEPLPDSLKGVECAPRELWSPEALMGDTVPDWAKGTIFHEDMQKENPEHWRVITGPTTVSCKVGSETMRKNKWRQSTSLDGRDHYCFWFEAECGVIMGSVAGWEYKVKTANLVAKNHYTCEYCQGTWREGRGSGRFVEVSNGEVKLQLILDGPDQQLFDKWAKSRVNWMKRFAPNGTLDDIPPPKGDPTQRHVLGPDASAAFWQHVLQQPEQVVSDKIDKIAEAAVQRAWLAHGRG